MKTPANPCTIHVIEAQDVVPYVAPQQRSPMTRVRPYIGKAFTSTGHGLMQTGRVAGFVLAELFHMIARCGVYAVKGVGMLYHALVTMLEFMCIKLPIFVIGLVVLLVTIWFVFSVGDAMFRGFFHLPRH